MFPVQIPLGTQTGLETQTSRETTGHLLIKNGLNAAISNGLVRLLPRQCPKTERGPVT